MKKIGNLFYILALTLTFGTFSFSPAAHSQYVRIMDKRDFLVVHYKAASHFKTLGVDIEPGVYISPLSLISKRNDLNRLVGGGKWEHTFDGMEKIEITVGFASGQAGINTRGEIWAVSNGQYFLINDKHRIAKGVPRDLIPSKNGLFLIDEDYKMVFVPFDRTFNSKIKPFRAPVFKKELEFQYYRLTSDKESLIYLSDGDDVIVLNPNGNSEKVTSVNSDPRSGPEVSITSDGIFKKKNADTLIYYPLGQSGGVGSSREIFKRKLKHESIVFDSNVVYLSTIQTGGGKVRYYITPKGEVTETGPQITSGRLSFEEIKLLDQFGENWSEMARQGQFDNILDREEYLPKVFRALTGDSNTWMNLVGANGVGKSSLLKTIAKKIASNRSQFGDWSDYEVYHFQMSSCIRLEAEEDTRITEAELAGDEPSDIAPNKFEKILDIIKNKKVVVVIDDFLDDPTLGSTNSAKSFDKFSEYFRGAIVNGDLKIITTSNDLQWQDLLESSPGIDHWSEVSHIKEPTAEELKMIVSLKLVEFQKRYRVNFASGIVNTILELTKKFSPEKVEPLRSVSAAENMAKGLGSKVDSKKIISIQEARQFLISEMMGFGKLNTIDYEELFQIINNEVVGQVDAKSKIIDELSVLSMGDTGLESPLATLFFIGPTGVGKTHTAKLIADFLELPIVHIDMNHFEGFDNDQFLYENVRKNQNNPFVLILDDVDKVSNPTETLNKLRGIIDNGIYAKGTERELNFRTAIIIMTGNYAADVILEVEPEVSRAELLSKVRKYVLDSNTPEESRIPTHVWSRLQSALVMFRPFEESELMELAIRFKDQLALEIEKTYGIEIHVDRELIINLVETNLEAKMGATPLKNRITREIKLTIGSYLRKARAKGVDQDITDILIKLTKSSRVGIIDNTDPTYPSLLGSTDEI